MFFANPNCAFRITGVFLVERSCEKDVLHITRKHTAIAYRVKGEGCFKYGEKSLVAPAGSVIYIPAFTDYERISISETLIIIHLQGFEDIGNSIEIVKNAEKAEPLFRKLLYSWENKDACSYNRCVQILYSIFEALQTVSDKQPDSVPEAIKAGVELMQKRYKDSSLRITDLADACFISEVYFRSIFHQYFGVSPQKSLITLRFSHACELLCSGYYTQKEAAELAGFSDVKYFRTAFKKQFGITPSEYKRLNQEKR